MDYLYSCTPDKDPKYSQQTEPYDMPDDEFVTNFAEPVYTWYHRLYQVVCFIVFLGPLRIVIGILVFTIVLLTVDAIRLTLRWLGCHFNTGKGTCYALARVGFRAILFGFGHVYIHTQGKADPEARFVISNHTALVDPFVIVMVRKVTCVIKKEIKNISIFAPALENVDPVFVDRSRSQGQTKQLIERADDFSLPPVLVFAEGTINNGSMILQLHKSAFLTPYKVQPMIIRYWQPLVPKGWNTYNWCVNNIVEYLLTCCCMPFSWVSVTYLPSITMEKEGKGDIETFSKKAQLIMANGLQTRAVTKGSTDYFAIKKERDVKKLKAQEEEKPKAE